MRLRSIVILILVFSMIGYAEYSLASQNDAGSGNDAPDNLTDALLISTGVWYTGQVGDNLTNVDGDEDNHDYYKVSLNPGYIRVTIGVTNVGVTSLTYIDVLKDGLIVLTEGIWNDDGNVTLVAPILSTGDYVILVNSYSDLVEYRFTVDNISGSYSQDDAGSGRDAELFSPVTVMVNTTYSGSLGNGHVESNGLLDTEDYFKVSVPSMGYLNMSITFTMDSSNSFYAYSKTSNYDTIISESTFFGSTIEMSTPIAEGGNYFIVFDSLGWNVSYDFSLSFVSAELPSQNDAGTGGDASEDPGSSFFVLFNESYVGTVGEGLLEVSNNARDDTDIYLLNVTHYGKLAVNLSIVGSYDSYPYVSLDLYNSSELFSSSYLDLSVSSFRLSELGEVNLTKGIYELEIQSWDANTTYRFDLKFIEMEKPVPPPTTTTATETTTATTVTTTDTTETTTATTVTTTETTDTTETTTSTTSLNSTLDSGETQTSETQTPISLIGGIIAVLFFVGRRKDRNALG